MSKHELMYDSIEVKTDSGELIKVEYGIIVGCLEDERLAAEVYGVRIGCCRGDGRSYETRVEGVTLSYERLLSILAVLRRCLVFPDGLCLALDELL